MSAKQPTSPPPGSRKPEPPPAPPAKTEALWTPEIARETRAFHVELIEAARTLGLLLDPTVPPVTTPYQALGVVRSANERLRSHVARGQDPDITFDPDALRKAGEAMAALPPTTPVARPVATTPAEPANATRLWNDAEAIYEAEFPRPRHYFGMLPPLAKIAYFERAALEAIERAEGIPHTTRTRVVSVEEMERYLRAAVPTEITDG